MKKTHPNKATNPGPASRLPPFTIEDVILGGFFFQEAKGFFVIAFLHVSFANLLLRPAALLYMDVGV